MPKDRSNYDQPKVKAKICDLIVSGVSVNKICKRKGMPSRVTIGKWMNKDPDFYLAYARAKATQTLFQVDDIIDISDDCGLDEVAKAKLRSDNRKWVASKLLPKVYGDTVHIQKEVLITHKTEIDNIIDATVSEILEIEASE